MRRVEDWGFGLRDLRFGLVGFWGLGLRVMGAQGLGFGACGVLGFGLRVWGWCLVWGLGLWVGSH